MRVESGLHKFDMPDDATNAEIGRKLTKLDKKLPKCGLAELTRMIKDDFEGWKYIDTKVLLDATGVPTDLRSTGKNQAR